MSLFHSFYTIRLFLVNGAWSSWGSYGSCNNKCGGGVQGRFRYCNNPAPAHGGKGCPGYSKMVKACNTHKCPGNYISFRLEAGNVLKN